MKDKNDNTTETDLEEMTSSNGPDVNDKGLDSLIGKINILLKDSPLLEKEHIEDFKIILILGFLLLNGFLGFLLLSLLD